MKYIFLFSFLFSALSFGQTTNFGKPPGTPGKLQDAYLKETDQKFYKNEAFAGENDSQRVDSLVKEINKLHGQIAEMKNQIQELQKDVENLKSKK